jgi:hypothetical protein
MATLPLPALCGRGSMSSCMQCSAGFADLDGASVTACVGCSVGECALDVVCVGGRVAWGRCSPSAWTAGIPHRP